MNKKILFACLAVLTILVSFGLRAADQGSGVDGTTTGGATSTVEIGRWARARVASVNAAATTNVIASGAYIIGGITVVPTAIGDTITVYNASSGVNSSNLTEIVSYTVSAGFSTNAFGIPVSIPVAVRGISAPLGITTIQTSGSGSTTFKAFIDYDAVITGRH